MIDESRAKIAALAGIVTLFFATIFFMGMAARNGYELEQSRRVAENAVLAMEGAQKDVVIWKKAAQLPPLTVSEVEMDGQAIRFTFQALPTAIIRMKSKELTWQDVKAMIPDINAGRVTVEEMHGDARGVSILLLSFREQSEVLPGVVKEKVKP